MGAVLGVEMALVGAVLVVFLAVGTDVGVACWRGLVLVKFAAGGTDRGVGCWMPGCAK